MPCSKAPFFIGLFCLTMFGSCVSGSQSRAENEFKKSNFIGIRGTVYELETGEGLPARIAIKNTSGNCFKRPLKIKVDLGGWGRNN